MHLVVRNRRFAPYFIVPVINISIVNPKLCEFRYVLGGKVGHRISAWKVQGSHHYVRQLTRWWFVDVANDVLF